MKEIKAIDIFDEFRISSDSRENIRLEIVKVYLFGNVGQKIRTLLDVTKVSVRV